MEHHFGTKMVLIFRINFEMYIIVETGNFYQILNTITCMTIFQTLILSRFWFLLLLP